MNIQEKIDQETKLFLFDLSNSAKEHWFGPSEGWQVSLATEGERVVLERHYYPILSTKALPEILAELLSAVKGKLNLAKTETENNFTLRTILRDHIEYLVAFNPERKR
jgi:hypothetical protein